MYVTPHRMNPLALAPLMVGRS